jgi:hypothetical protein
MVYWNPTGSVCPSIWGYLGGGREASYLPTGAHQCRARLGVKRWITNWFHDRHSPCGLPWHGRGTANGRDVSCVSRRSYGRSIAGGPSSVEGSHMDWSPCLEGVIACAVALFSAGGSSPSEGGGELVKAGVSRRHPRA